MMKVCRQGRLEVTTGFSFPGQHRLLVPLHLSDTVWYAAKGLCKLCCTPAMQTSNAP